MEQEFNREAFSDFLGKASESISSLMESAKKSFEGMAEEEFRSVMRKAQDSQRDKIEIYPFEAPIEVAQKLIQSTWKCSNTPLSKAFGGGEYHLEAYYGVSELKQIAKHLLVYCDSCEESGNVKDET